MTMQAVPALAAPTPSRWPGRIAFMLLGGFLAAAILVVSGQPRHTPTVRYDDVTHQMGVVTEHTWLGDDEYLLYVGQDPGMSYGHFVASSPAVVKRSVLSRAARYRVVDAESVRAGSCAFRITPDRTLRETT
ncbi:MAG: hypothetical protein GEV11_01390 [Streptosporangiales bacterium]|nr:hypothetical protein [Streptosporangiales bacterium]